jgi:flagellar motor switch protein FliN/FliY
MSEAEQTNSNLEADIQAVYDVPLQVSAVLGKSYMKVQQLVKLARGSVVELDRNVGDAVDVFINDRLVAKGEIVLVENKIGITITELVKRDA